MVFLKNLFKNIWTLIGSVLALVLFYFWYSDEKGWEAFIGLCTSIFVFLGSSYSYVFYSPLKKPKLEIDIEGQSRIKGVSKDKEGNPVPHPKPNIKYQYKLYWNYIFFIRNYSTHPAFKPKLHLKKNFRNLVFPELNQGKPILMGWISEMYVKKIAKLHSKEPAILNEKYALEAKFTKHVETDKESIHLYGSAWFPQELENLEFLLEYSNEDGERFYTLFKRNSNGELENEISTSKPFYYTWGGALISSLMKR